MDFILNEQSLRAAEATCDQNRAYHMSEILVEWISERNMVRHVPWPFTFGCYFYPELINTLIPCDITKAKGTLTVNDKNQIRHLRAKSTQNCK